MTSVIKHFLLVFDRATQDLVEAREFGADRVAAIAAYADAERQYQGDARMQIVLIGSDSIETVRITHSNFFAPTETGSRFFAGL